MADDDSLYWSDDLLSWFEDDGYEAPYVVPTDYLFRSDGNLGAAFAIIADEMAQLNDYCVLCTLQTKKHLNWLRQELKDLVTGRQRAVAPSGDYTSRAIIAVGSEVYTWEKTYSFVTRAMCLLLLSAFTEKSLKSLCLAFAPAGQSLARFKKWPGESEVAHYLRFLRDVCGLQFAEPDESVAAREACRHIRNTFAHGDWDKVTEQVTAVGLRQAFAAVANLLKSIEAGAGAAQGHQAAGRLLPIPSPAYDEALLENGE